MNKYALIVANGAYEDAKLRQLVAPCRDASNLAAVLAEPTIGGYQVSTSQDQSSHEVLIAIEAFFADRSVDDLLLLYISGHGIKDAAGKLYFATRNTSTKLLKATGISANFINESMKACRSRRKVLILDSCFSGAFAKGMVARSDLALVADDIIEQGHGEAVLTASDSFQYAFEGDDLSGHGVRSVFTKHLVHGLKSGEADIKNDGIITLDGLYSYVYRRVTEEMPEQRPRKWAFDTEGDIIIAHNPNPLAVTLPEDIQEGLRDRRPWVRQSAVTELVELAGGSHKGLARAARNALVSLGESDDSKLVSELAKKALAEVPQSAPLGVHARQRHGRDEAPPNHQPSSIIPSAERSVRHRDERAHEESTEHAIQDERTRWKLTTASFLLVVLVSLFGGYYYYYYSSSAANQSSVAAKEASRGQEIRRQEEAPSAANQSSVAAKEASRGQEIGRQEKAPSAANKSSVGSKGGPLDQEIRRQEKLLLDSQRQIEQLEKARI